MIKQKVFGIGFHKTGTKTLAKALTLLGYRVTGPNGVNDQNIRHNLMPMVLELAEQYDAFQDNPWPLVYQQMSQLYPESKFILTLRETDSWIKSVCNHFGSNKTPMRELIYGVGYPLGNESHYCSVYEKHNQEVLQFFEKQHDRLLIVNFSNGDGWDKICTFLQKPLPSFAFPHENKGNYRAPNIP